MIPFVLVGEAPGPKTDPLRPLWPHTTNGAAARLIKLMGLSLDEYLGRTLRFNALHDGHQALKLESARKRVADLLQSFVELDPQTHFVFLGRKAVQTAPPQYRSLQACERDGNVLYVPHPSGTNLWYNSAAHTQQASMALRAHLAAAGGVGTLPPPVHARVPYEALQKVMQAVGQAKPPPGPGMRLEEVEWLLQCWSQETQCDSSLQVIAKNPSARKLFKEQGLRLVPTLVEKLAARAPGQVWGWFMLLEELTGQRPYKEHQRGDLAELRRAWVQWYAALR